LRGRYKNERNLPARQDMRGDLPIARRHLFLALTFDAARRRVNLAELDQLLVLLAALLGDHRALVVDILGLGALEVAVVADLADDAEALRATRKAAQQSSRTLVLAPAHLYSRCGYH